MSFKPDFKLAVGIPLSVEEIAEGCPDLDESKIISVLKSSARKHRLLFGVELFKIQYNLTNDCMTLIPGPVVGRVDCLFFTLTFEPKFRDITVGKCLAFAQICGAIELLNHSNDVVEDEVSYESLTKSVDYFAKAFLSAVYDILHLGILETRTLVARHDSNLRGDIDFQKSIESASEFPVVNSGLPTINLPVNQYIKGAVRKVLDSACCSEIKGIAGQAMNVFCDVEDVDISLDEVNLNNSTTLKRPDYERCVALAEIIYNGYWYLDGEESSFSPFFTINLDLLFEKLVEFSLKNQVAEDNFRIIGQLESEHPAEPAFKDKYLKPDILLEPKNSDNHKNIIIDCKNKYSYSNNDKLSISNSDIYQIVYYANCFKTNYAVLVYPGNRYNCTKYPIPSSEGRSAYLKKRDRAFGKVKEESYTCLTFDSHKIDLFFWRIDLTGSMKDTEQSFAQLALFLTDLSKRELV